MKAGVPGGGRTEQRGGKADAGDDEPARPRLRHAVAGTGEGPAAHTCGGEGQTNDQHSTDREGIAAPGRAERTQ